MKKVLVIDDSALMRRVLSDIIENTNEYKVAYTANDGIEALSVIEEYDDISVIFCDIVMPRMNGLELLKVLKYKNVDIPVVMFSSSKDTKDTITALELGAIEFIKKPEKVLGQTNTFFEKRVHNALKIAEDIVANSSLKVASHCDSGEIEMPIRTSSHSTTVKRLVALVCSTGGPSALQKVIPLLPSNLAAPVIVVQHMPAGFTATLAERLDDLSKIKVKEAADGEILKNGVVYIAKGGTHLTVSEDTHVPRIKFDDSPPVVGLKPFGNIMYNSLQGLSYDEIVCVVLTGMGEDGTKGILNLAVHKDIYVIAQDEASSTVYGMPRAVKERGLTDCVCDINKIADKITKKVGVL
ncbi:MAG: chemotaxis-specific protein-glutamate methyltransferase CheB [Lachnospiraceae bacterium]|nr:chemotaxis-specific protein-glutamate methyltransferase CheB [Lachnospiraceae bacterium]